MMRGGGTTNDDDNTLFSEIIDKINVFSKRYKRDYAQKYAEIDATDDYVNIYDDIKNKIKEFNLNIDTNNPITKSKKYNLINSIVELIKKFIDNKPELNDDENIKEILRIIDKELQNIQTQINNPSSSSSGGSRRKTRSRTRSKMTTRKMRHARRIGHTHSKRAKTATKSRRKSA